MEDFFVREFQDAREEMFLFTLHLEATMMKVSNPIMFGHRVKAYFSDERVLMGANDNHVENHAVLEFICWCSGARILSVVSGLSSGCRPRWPGALGMGISPATVSPRPLGAL